MREISTVLGQLAKPVDLEIPKDLVSSSPRAHPSFLSKSEEIDST